VIGSPSQPPGNSGPRRAIATVLFTDIVGSTERAARLGDRRWAELLQRHHARVRDLLARHGGREVATAGDGFLAIFDRPAHALHCAAAIRDAVHEMDLSVRCGLHTGAIEIAEDDVGGIAVHIGARVAALAEADEILVSRTVRDTEEGSGFSFEDRGVHELKGVDGEWRIFALTGLPEIEDAASVTDRAQGRHGTARFPGSRLGRIVGIVAALIVLALAGWWVLGRPTRSDAAGPVRSLAVLPLANLSNDPQQAYFVDGLHDVLIGELSRLDSLTVISRTSVLRYREPSESMGEIARELGVDAVVEGSVFRSGDSVRVQVQLIRGSPERHLWNQTYDGPVRDALGLQTRVAREIADEIRLVVTPQVAERLAGEEEVPAAAQEAYYRGRALWRTRTMEGMRDAIPLLEEAVRIDPTFARGWSALADAYTMGKNYGALDVPGEEMNRRAEEAARRALDLDPELAEAQAALGAIRLYSEWDVDGGEAALREAVRLNPSYAQAYNWLADALAANGRLDEALAAFQRARELDPFSALMNRDLARGYVGTGDCDKAREYTRIATELDPGITSATMAVVLCLRREGRFDEAVEAMIALLRSGGEDSERLAEMERAFQAGGWRAWEREVIRDASYSKSTFLDQAVAHALLGDRDGAFAALRSAREAHESWALIVRYIEPALEPLRSDPRWEEYVRE
jgi:adenylate cyclase